MSLVHTAVTLYSRERGGAVAPAEAVGEVIRLTPPVLRRCVRMAAEGRSWGHGRPPGWLTAAAGVTFAGADPAADGGTVLHFEAPRLGNAAPEVFAQHWFAWEEDRPDADATAFDLFAAVLADVRAGDRDSDRFDRDLLTGVRKFRGGIGRTPRTAARFAYTPTAGGRQVVVDPQLLSAAGTLLEETPRPRRAKLVGTLDMARASTRAFALTLDSGEELRGVLTDDDEADARRRLSDLFGERVTALGRLIYRSSGRPLRFDAETLEAAAGSERVGAAASFFSRLPPVPSRDVRPTADRRGRIAAVVGRWPGTETDEEIAAALRELS